MSDEEKRCVEENVRDQTMKDETPDKSEEKKRTLLPSCSTQNPKRVKLDRADKSEEEKRSLSAPSCSTQNPKQVKFTTVDRAATETENSKEGGPQDCNDNPPRLSFELPKLSELPTASEDWNDVDLPINILLLTLEDSTETENSKEDGSQDCNDNPPRLSFKLPKLSELPTAIEDWNDVDLPIDILLLTVEDCEFLGCLYYLDKPFKSYCDIGFVYFGSMGCGNEKKLKVALMKCSEGSAVPGGSLTVVKDAVRVLKPKAVFSVGACSGLNNETTKLGDVVVSSTLITLAHKTPVSRNIGYLIRHVADGWKAPLENPDVREVRVHRDGEVLSSQEAVNEDIQKYPKAIAVEMEGEGLFAAAHGLKTEWVLIKGIKDYADGSQSSSDEWGVFASVMAASVVANILRDSVVFEGWSHYNQDKSEEEKRRLSAPCCSTQNPKRAKLTMVHRAEASPVETFDLKTCQSKLAKHYQKTAKVPTTVWSSICELELDQIYTRLSWVKEEKTRAGSSQKKLGHYTEMFTEKTKNGFVQKRILVRGQTGIGKTTFVKKLLVDWSNLDDAKMEEQQKDALRKFELVVAVTLKEVSRCQTLGEVINHSRLFPKDEEYSTDDLLCYIRKNQDKVLLVFDGYDEYRTVGDAEIQYDSRSNSPIYEIFHGDNLRDCTVLVTTRSSRADEVRGSADMQAEITGFDVSDRKAFMVKMLDGETEVDDLLKFLRTNKMQELARVPLLTLFFCLLWREEKEKLIEIVKSKAKLYRAIVQHILQYSHRKHSPTQACKVKEENYEEILTEIGKVALTGLLKGDLVFEYGQLPEKVRGEKSLIVGLFQLSEYGPSLEPMEMVSFIHKSMQEFLAAWYITYRCVPEGNLGGIEEHARTLGDCKALENVFLFICGLSDDGAVKVFEHLTSVRISDPTLDLSKTIPDVENEADVPLCDVTNEHFRLHNLVYNSFQEVHSKAELLTHCFNCTGGIILVTKRFTELLQKAKVKDLTQVTHSVNFLHIPSLTKTFSAMCELVECLDCMPVTLRITKSSEALTIRDFLRRFQIVECYRPCFFDSMLCFRNGLFQYYITKWSLLCDDHFRLFTETIDTSGLPLSETMCSEPFCLKLETSLQCYRVSDQAGKTLGETIRNSKHLKGIRVDVCDDSVCDLLEQVVNPSKYSLEIGYDPYQECYLTSAGAVKLARLLPRFNNIFNICLALRDCCAAAVDTLVPSITHKTLKELVLWGISLTPAVAAALGRSLPEMSSLQKLLLTGSDESNVQAEEMESLFGGFNKTLPLLELTFSGFSVISCLVPLTKSLRFFPILRELYLGELNMDERNLCDLLESLRFIPNLEKLSVTCKPLSHAQCCTAEVNTAAGFTHKTLERLVLSGISLTPAVAAALGRSLPEMSSLQKLLLTGSDESNVQAEEMESLFGGFNKTLPLLKLTFSGFSVISCLAPLTKSFCFFPILRKLYLGELNMDEHNLCHLLESLRFIPNLEKLSVTCKPLSHAQCCTAEVNTAAGFTHKSLRELVLIGISLTPTVAAMLGRLPTEMPPLFVLKLTGADASNVQAEEMEALCGRFIRSHLAWTTKVVFATLFCR